MKRKELINSMQKEITEHLHRLENALSAFNMILTAMQSEGQKSQYQDYKALCCVYEQLADAYSYIATAISKEGDL